MLSAHSTILPYLCYFIYEILLEKTYHEQNGTEWRRDLSQDSQLFSLLLFLSPARCLSHSCTFPSNSYAKTLQKLSNTSESNLIHISCGQKIQNIWLEKLFVCVFPFLILFLFLLFCQPYNSIVLFFFLHLLLLPLSRGHNIKLNSVKVTDMIWC